MCFTVELSRENESKCFWCRCGWGTHPFPSRTRRLRPNRPMVLHWRRCGRAGGRQIKKEKASLAWWNRCWFYQWFKKKRYFLLKWLIKHQSALYLENCIHEIWLKLIKYPWYKTLRDMRVSHKTQDRKTSITKLSKTMRVKRPHHLR